MIDEGDPAPGVSGSGEGAPPSRAGSGPGSEPGPGSAPVDVSGPAPGRPPLRPAGLAAIAGGCAAVGLLTAVIWRVWGPIGSTALQWRLVPQLVAIGVAVIAGAAALVALAVLAHRLTTGARPVVRVGVRVLTDLLAAAAFLVLCLHAFVALLVSDGETRTVDGQEYGMTIPFLGTLDDACYHDLRGPLLMERTCRQLAGAPGPASSGGTASSGSSSSEGTAASGADGAAARPAVGDPWTAPLTDAQVVAEQGDVAILQVEAQLGQRGTYVAATRTPSGWSDAVLLADGESFTSLEQADGLLVAGFAPSPEPLLMVSMDGGRTWEEAQFPDGAPPEEQAFLHGVSRVGDGFGLTLGYPSWVDTSGTLDTTRWTSRDAVTWVRAL